MYHGDITLGDTIDIKFCTVDADGAPTQLAGTPVISAYPGNSTTQLTAGITLSVDFDGVTGLNNVRVVATSGNGYAAATNYFLVITTGTVDGTSAVGYVIGSFSISNRYKFREAPQKNVAFPNIEFLMVDATDGITPETGLTVSGERSLDGGAFGAVSGSIAEVSDGIYQFDAAAADMNGDTVTFRFSATGAADRFLTFKTTT